MHKFNSLQASSGASVTFAKPAREGERDKEAFRRDFDALGISDSFGMDDDSEASPVNPQYKKKAGLGQWKVTNHDSISRCLFRASILLMITFHLLKICIPQTPPHPLYPVKKSSSTPDLVLYGSTAATGVEDSAMDFSHDPFFISSDVIENDPFLRDVPPAVPKLGFERNTSVPNLSSTGFNLHSGVTYHTPMSGVAASKPVTSFTVPLTASNPSSNLSASFTFGKGAAGIPPSKGYSASGRSSDYRGLSSSYNAVTTPVLQPLSSSLPSSHGFVMSSSPFTLQPLKRGHPSSSSMQSDAYDMDSDSEDDQPSLAGAKSCPDLQGLGGGDLTNDEVKKQRRLARNRASARLRRLKKKTLIETLELDINEIDDDLLRLKNLKRSPTTLYDAEAVGAIMIPPAIGPSGKKAAISISKERRSVGITAVIQRQIQQLEKLWDDYLIDAALAWGLGHGLDPALEGPSSLAYEMRQSLFTTLKLTNSQRQLLEVLAISIDAERDRLVMVDKCLKGLLLHEEWIKVAQVDTVSELFRSIVEVTQHERYSEFIDRNTPLVQTLDISPEPPK
jgi:hypothetical protein